MRAGAGLAIVLLAQGGKTLHAQEYVARLGVTAGTPLARDRIVDPIEVTQALAPTLALGAAFVVARSFRAGVEAAFTSGRYLSSEPGTEAHLGTLRTGALTLGLDGPVAARLRWRLGTGFLSYWPAEERGIFLRGGSTRLLAGGGLDYRRTIRAKWSFMASLRLDFHRFTTEQLQARGFSGAQGVRRVSVTLGLANAR